LCLFFSPPCASAGAVNRLLPSLVAAPFPSGEKGSSSYIFVPLLHTPFPSPLSFALLYISPEYTYTNLVLVATRSPYFPHNGFNQVLSSVFFRPRRINALHALFLLPCLYCAWLFSFLTFALRELALPWPPSEDDSNHSLMIPDTPHITFRERTAPFS